MIKGTLESGFDYEVDENNLDDMRLFDDLAAMEENPLVTIRVIEKILGKEQKEKLYKHLEKDGRVPTKDFSDALSEIIEKTSQLKN